jgi:hypothetical protein
MACAAALLAAEKTDPDSPTTLRRILNSCFVGASIDARQGDDE